MLRELITKSSNKKKAKERSILLLSEAKRLATMVNTTTDEYDFFESYDKLIKIFEELCLYEKYHFFNTKSPSQNLKEIKEKQQIATEDFFERRRKYLSKTKQINLNGLDPLFVDAGRLIVTKDKASIGMLQREFKIGFNRASSIMEQLSKYGVVGEEIGVSPRSVLMTPKQFEHHLYKIENALSVENGHQEELQTPQNPHDFDIMDGHDFEYFCAGVLKKIGFIEATVTQGSGDHGIDILAEKDDITYAIQCKCYSSNIGNAAVQQAHTGKTLYHKDVAVVMTNRYFTQQAKDEAAQLGVKLWDRDKLNDLIKKANI